FKLNDDDLNDAKEPWRMRFCALQNVTINLPRLGYKTQGDEKALFSEITALIELAVKSHFEKKAFIQDLLALGESGPLSLLTMAKDGTPYLRMHRASYLIGMVGLNELVKSHVGDELHESRRAIKFGLKVISHMNLLCEKYSKEHDMHFVLEQTPAESTAYRFAKLDLRDYPAEAGKHVKGDMDCGEVYYTNSTCLPVYSQENPIERVKVEGLFHPIIEAGAITHIWLGESKPSKESLANFVVKVFRETQNDQIAFSPEFTNCLQCGQTVRGLQDACPHCGSEEIDGITRITGYFTKISSWNKGKLGELKERNKNRGFFVKK
ncbi:MAG: anaerobic ribonucleoside-triphosphate reductase, partial [Deltaproteobacteria bacterium]|nr:anaerobic ribonucleoside-triphosphate reductase [Deltaproteobacteria bacterium]